jgi:phosphotransferase system HPr (HPr) family protein
MAVALNEWNLGLEAIWATVPSLARTLGATYGDYEDRQWLGEHEDRQWHHVVCSGPAITFLRPRSIEPPMSHDTPTDRRQVQILNSLGLHLRPARKFVELALQFQSEIRVHYNGNEFDGKSILDLTTVAAECGTLLELEARGSDAVQAIDALSSLVAARFHENEDGDSIEIPVTREPVR